MLRTISRHHVTCLSSQRFGFCAQEWLAQQGSRGVHSSSSRNSTIDPPVVPKAQSSTVVLMTGSIESAALLAYWHHWSHAQKLHPLFVELGHKSENHELRAARQLCHTYGLDLSVLNASMVGHEIVGEQERVQNRWDVRRVIPHRNLLIVSLAASYASGVSKSSQMALCINQDDLNTYSSSSTSFIRHMDSTLATLEPPLQLLTPLARLSKWQIVQMGEKVHAPWEHTYVCLDGGLKHCGRCQKCVERKQAFSRAGIEEPWGTYDAVVV